MSRYHMATQDQAGVSGPRRLSLLLSALLVSGCVAQPPSTPPVYTDGPVTFSNQVARLFQHHCQTCHRPGEVAPFSLVGYEDTHLRRQKILKQVRERKMPPWPAAPGLVEFDGVRRLSEAEIDLIARWVEAGAPEGDPKDLPAPRKFPTGWRLGTPDAVLAMQEPFTVPARTSDIYRCFVIPVRIASPAHYQSILIRASEVLPGNRKVVHHVQTFIDTTGTSLELDRKEPGPGYTCFGGAGFQSTGGLGGWVPGMTPAEVAPGVAWGIPPGAHLVMQVHYNNPGDTPETDLTRIGIHFAHGPFHRRAHRVQASAWGFWIPAGAERHVVTTAASLREDLEATSVFAHMHLIGRAVKITAHETDGTKRVLLSIDRWDFDWQLRYDLKRPVPLPSGTVIEVECVYDNSAGNDRNPSRPPRDVRSGFETTDEMCKGVVLGTVRRF